MKCLSIIFILIFGLSVLGQKTVADLKPAHAVALEEFLSKNKVTGFYLKRKRLYFGVFESDADTFTMTPVGKGYIIEYDNAP